MSRTFVTIDDPVHSLMRALTRRTPLCPGPVEDGLPLLQYRIREMELPNAYFSLATLHAIGGMSLEALPTARWRVRDTDRAAVVEQVNFFDILKLDKRCARDLRIKLKKQGPTLLAGELLAYGIGTLRARNDDPELPLHHYLWNQHGRIQTDHEVVYATIRTLIPHHGPVPVEVGRESYDSTNLIYGDAHGELEQVWDRRDDVPFLEALVRNLQRLRRHHEIAAYLCPPLHLAAVLQLHLERQALWLTPPPGVRALLRRVEFILSNTLVEAAAQTSFNPVEGLPHPQPPVHPDPVAHWEADRSGYDGWLA